MRRRHWIEIHEQPWCPPSLRDAATDFLQLAVNLGDHYRYVFPILCEAIKRTAPRRIVDLCSGGGGPWLKLHRELPEHAGRAVPITLTDLHPNLEAYRYAHERSNGALEGWDRSVDATDVPEELDGFRTLFSSFHHFQPEAARGILQDAVLKRQGIGICDTSRGWGMLLFMSVALVLVPLSVPLVRPFRWTTLFWTYLLPLLPLLTVFDGVVSCLRSYTPDELRELTRGLEGEPYEWEIGRAPLPNAPFHVTYLIGCPVSPDDSSADSSVDHDEGSRARY